MTTTSAEQQGRNIALDELCLMQDRLNTIKADADKGLAQGESLLIPKIKNISLSTRFKMLTITLYDGKTDPNNHIIAF